ncbi:nuclear apoptosis-inducing factor 1-like [Actinia tenebrosa]|uniref:Nuclear apoptosis-inducing factor 1-like n=1 Tax=Actinia tenebrosa TaxID=6105 RepID=A0A6P8H1I1_ACTTE|nr:nuclear apoptosis-inducing factor 1-like [Actinia tenebrosa]
MEENIRSKRKPNFTEMENLFLIEEFEKNKEVLRSKINSTEMNRQKLAVWQSICVALNTKNPLVRRSVDEVRRKWKNMVTIARKDTAHYNPTKPPSQVSQRIMRGYSSDSKHNPSQIPIICTSPTGSINSAAPEEPSHSKLVHHQNEDDSLCKMETSQSNSVTSDHEPPANEQLYPRMEEVRAAEGCGMEVVQPGPPAAALTEQTRQSMRRPNNIAFRTKRNNIQSILYSAKRRRLQANQDMANGTTSFDLQQLQKEKLILEKEKIVLEKEKLMLEKEKLSLEIQCLRSQLQNDEPEY